jgi:hypothetical protein
MGDGPGPEGESVRIVGRPRRNGGFTVCYVRSYEPGRGNARMAYEYLSRHFGGEIHAVEVRSEEGVAFHRRMIDLGIVAHADFDLPDDPPKP